MTVNRRSINIFLINGNKQRITTINSTSLRKALVEFAAQQQLTEPVFVGNTLSGFLDGEIKQYEAQEA